MIELTDEMRRAVHDEDCARLGHDVSFNAALGAGGTGLWQVRGPDGQIAHLSCRRCGRVWLIVEEPGAGYTDAVARLRARVKDPGWVRPLPRPAAPARPEPPTR